MKGLKIVVLAKQVPDTRNVGKDAMKADGTVNRAALPAIFNPEDLNALEQALRIKDKIEGTTVHILTMGPGRAAEIIREAMYRGADGGYLLSDRAFAGSDTLATSYALACALRNLQTDLLICGRQAIDGDTAQVGPQVAEKLGLPQVTYAEDILDITAGKITIKLTEYAEEASSKKASSGTSSSSGKSGSSSKSAAGIATYKELGISSSAVSVGASSSAKASKKPTNAQLK